VELESRFGDFSLLNFWVSDLPEDFRSKLFSLGQVAVQAGAAEEKAAAAKPEPPAVAGESLAASDAAPAGGADAESASGSAAAEPIAVIKAPAKLLEIGQLAAELSLSLPSEISFYREIELPFSDLKKIGQVIRLEAEGYFPFPLDDYLIEFLPPHQEGEASQVLTFVLNREFYSAILQQLKSFNLDPAFTGIEGLTLPLLSMRDAEYARLWVEIGAKRTIVVAALGTTPFLYRRIPIGISELVLKLSREAGISPERAERYLAEVGIQSPSKEPEAGIISGWLNSLLSPVKETVRWFERSRKGMSLVPNFEQIIVCGGGGNLAGIDSYFSEKLGIATGKFRIPGWVNLPEGFQVRPDQEALLAEPLSLALARLSKEGKRLVNFRKGEFFYKAGYELSYRKIVFPAGLLLVMLVLGVAKAAAQYSLLKSQRNQIKQEIDKEYTALFPGAKPTDPVSQLKQAYGLGKERVAASSKLFYPSAVDCLAAVGDQVPKELGYRLSRYSYSGSKVRLEGETADFASVKDIADRLAKVEFFKKVSQGDSRTAANGKVNFVIEIELKNPAEQKIE